MKILPALVGVLVGTALAAPAFADPVSVARVHASASRAVGLLEQSIRIWHQKQTCYSCHHQGLAISLVEEARRRGIPVDVTLARRNISVGLQGLKNLDRAVQAAQQIDPASETGSQMAAAHAAGVPQGLAREVYAAVIARKQRPDGAWDTLDNRPPQSWSRVTATAMALAAIRAYLPESRQEEAGDRLRRARDWLLAVHPRDVEERTYQILGAIQADVDRGRLKPMATALLSEQRPDGGWAQFSTRASDAYATGEALVALYESGVGPNDAAFQRGLRYLLDSQFPDGSWRVPTRMHEQDLVSPPHFETGFPHGADQMISVMGTVWAARAVLRAVPERRMRPEPLITASEWTEAEAAPWMRVALFGSSAELERLLSSGLNPNSRTEAGTTILMMAAADRDKVDTLIRHGADVNLAAKTGFTPLMIAANDGDAAAAIRLLVERGAVVAPSNPKPLHDASPLYYGVWSGNVETVRLLIERGADVRAKVKIGGIFAAAPLELAAILGDVPMVRALAAAGSDVNRLSESGLPVLTSAVMTNRVEIAKTLIALGANINLVDELSMTPLMHAALVDYGDTEMVALLLAAGATKDLRSKDNDTALDLARQHGHDAIARLLERPKTGN